MTTWHQAPGISRTTHGNNFCSPCCLLVLFTAGLLAPQHGLAGTVTVRLQLSYSLDAQGLSARLAASNSETEPARGLRAFLHGFGRTLVSESPDRLDVGRGRTFSFVLACPPDRKGQFPLVGELFFRNAEGLTFSALAGALVQLGETAPCPLIGRADHHAVTGQGALSFRVLNPTPQPLSCLATLHVPHGLAAPVKTGKVDLAPGEETIFSFPVIDRYGIQGAGHAVLCVLEYIESGTHHAAIITGRVRTLPPENRLRRTRRHWLLGLPLLGAAWVVLLTYGRWRARSSKPQARPLRSKDTGGGSG